jgi:hypothetical protein
MSRRKSHAIMPPLVPDSEDGKIVIKPTGDGRVFIYEVSCYS